MKHIIWSNELNYEDWQDDLESQYPDEEGYDEEDRIRLMHEINDEYLLDEKITLDKELGHNIILVANLGLWNGRRMAYRVVGTNINDIFTYSCGDYVTWYIEDDEVKCKDVHHDGTNLYTYRVLKSNIDQFEFDEYACEHSTLEAVKKYTKPIGKYVKDIYGLQEEK
jgi:hypothetical protein